LNLTKLIVAISLLMFMSARANGQETLAKFQASPTVETILFSESDRFIYVIPTESYSGSPVDYPGGNVNMGLREYKTPDGESCYVPLYVLNIRMVLESAKNYFDEKGLAVNDISAGNRLNIYIKSVAPDSERDKNTGEARGGKKAQTQVKKISFSFGRYMEIDLALSPDNMLTTPVHEYFHLVTEHIWGTGTSSQVNNIAVEGTAEWATDEPVPITPLVGPDYSGNKDILKARTTNEINAYFKSRQDWFKYLSTSLFSHDQYDTVFLWKYLSQSFGGSMAIRSFWDKFSQGSRGQNQFIQSIGAVTGGQGDLYSQYRKFYMDFVAANIVQVGAPLGFSDDAFSNRPTIINIPRKVVRSHYSSSTRPQVQQTVASDNAEIQRRLDQTVVKISDINLFGMGMVVIDTPDGGIKPDSTELAKSIEEPMHIFLQASGDLARDDAWGAVAVTQSGGERDSETANYNNVDRGKNIGMARLENFTLQKSPELNGRSSAYTHFDSFARDIHFIWLGLANLDEKLEAKSAGYAFAITPVFQKSFANGEGRDTATVHFLKSTPERELNKDFHPGDRIELEVDLSDMVHDGNDSDIDQKMRSLEIKISAPDGSTLTVEDEKVSCSDLNLYHYRYGFTIPKNVDKVGKMTVEWTVRSRLKLGEQDKKIDRSFTFNLSKVKPKVLEVKLKRDSETFFSYPSVTLRPVTPGEVDLEIYFDKDMNRKIPAQVFYDNTPISGEWNGDKVWRGRFQVPSGDAFIALKGFHPLSLKAESSDGAQVDKIFDPDKKVPEARQKFLIDAILPIVTEVKILAKGKKIYEAEWSDGPDNSVNLLSDSLGEKKRELDVSKQDGLPADGKGEIYINFSQPLNPSKLPKVSVGGVDVAMSMDDFATAWKGNFDIAAVQQKAGKGKPVQVLINAVDQYGNALDGNPRTVSGLETKQPWWIAYEDGRAGKNTGRGGSDNWHELSIPPTISLVLVLDASGSMKDSGKFDSSKKAINDLLNNLSPSIELAVVIASDCNNIGTVGFTRDVEKIRAFVNSASPYGATALAAALDEAKRLLKYSTNSQSYDWRYKVFSDGKETCKGNVIAQARKLDSVIAERRGKQLPNKDLVPPPSNV
jgi:Mg-chelatase subunit ChlD